MIIENKLVKLEIFEGSNKLWNYQLKDTLWNLDFGGPVFEVDGTPLTAGIENLKIENCIVLKNNVCEYVLTANYIENPELSLSVFFRIADDNPIVRFRYILRCKGKHRLTKLKGKDDLKYLSASYSCFTDTIEVRFSEFNEMTHSFCLSEVPIKPEHFENRFKVMGPMLVGSNSTHTMLIAYEHGSQVPDAFINFELKPDHTVSLRAVKGNYYDGFELQAGSGYESIWLQAGAVKGNTDCLASAYRDFMLKYISLNLESRKPYIFYNTWAFQERNKFWNGKMYLDSMVEERILAEIEVAHRMEIEVFVIDTGWYEKTGDWRVNEKRFSKNLKQVKQKLDDYGMKLGLLFDPTVAAVSSNILKNNEDCIISWDGKESEALPIWETEESKSMCLPSKYHEAFADELIRLVKEVGVTYFKLDAVNQYGCSDPRHYHGNESNSLAERKDCYAFQIGIYMEKVVEKLSQACPEVIVDFDITEGFRAVGLGFLSVGKYFLINNGPYYSNFNIPFDGNNGYSNVFVYPGPARSRICRTPINFDKWLPSVLFLTHYLPDDPETNQNISVASLILGQNGLWGDLLAISEEGIDRISKLLRMYKQVRDDITSSSLVSYGSIGSSLEVREKISSDSGRGVISIFSETPGEYSYITSQRVSSTYWASEGVRIEMLESGKAIITAKFIESDAKIIFFGIS